jgi:hypothetical protein
VDERTGRARSHSRVGEHALALLAFVLLSLIVYGHAVIGNISTVFAGVGFGPGRDQAQVSWCLEWIARALRDLHNPLFTNAVYVPHGYSLAWAPSLPGPATLLAPLTLAAGAIVTFNVLAITAPGIAAWTAYLLCRTVDPTRRPWPALAGGLLFGFGTYETVEASGHLNLALTALLPLATLLAVLRSRGQISRALYVGALGLVLALQMYTSTEVLATGVLFGALALVAWKALDRSAPAGRLAIETGGALCLMLVLGVPLLIEMATSRFPLLPIYGSGVGIDAANLIAPTKLTMLPDIGSLFIKQSNAGSLAVNLTESDGYIGVPLLVLLGLYFWEARRTTVARLLLVIVLAGIVFSLGRQMLIAHHVTSFPLPWRLLSELPLIEKVIAARMMVYFWLAGSVAASLWLVRRSPWRLALFALVCVSLIPATWSFGSSTVVERPALTTNHALLARTLPAGAIVIAAPWGSHGNSMLWQLQSQFHYRMVGGYLGPTPAIEYRPYRKLIAALAGGRVHHPLTGELCGLLRFSGARYAIVRVRRLPRHEKIFGPLGIAPRRVGGFFVYELAPALAPGGACSDYGRGAPSPIASRTSATVPAAIARARSAPPASVHSIAAGSPLSSA